MNAKDFYIKQKHKNTDFLNTEIEDNLNAVAVWNFAEDYHKSMLDNITSSSRNIQSGKLTKCQCIKPDAVDIKICLECNGIRHSV